MQTTVLDDPRRITDLIQLIEKKHSLKSFYLDMYARFAVCLARCPKEGVAIELGSGGGFLKKIIPDVITSDVLPYPNVDQVIDGTAMPFEDGSLKAILMLNVFHHISNAKGFLKEVQRCLMPGGRLFLIDQHPGWIGYPIYKYIHHEPFDAKTAQWEFDSSGPLSGANGALAWIVFRRDIRRFESLFPKLKLERYQPHSPLRYWLSGGLKSWNLVPAWAYGSIAKLDTLLVKTLPQLGSFVDIEVIKNK